MSQELAQPKKQPKEVVYQSMTGDVLRLNGDIVKAYLVSGNKNLVSGAEVNMFLRLCQYQKLNPFLKEVYLIKYDAKTPASIVIGKETFTKRAEQNADYIGKEAGIVVLTKEGVLENRVGTICLDSEKLVGGWAKVYRKSYQYPVEITVSLGEYNTSQSKWRTAPATMIRKVALVQALREAFPTALGALYDRDELGVEGDNPIGDIIVEPPQNDYYFEDEGVQGEDGDGVHCVTEEGTV